MSVDVLNILYKRLSAKLTHTQMRIRVMCVFDYSLVSRGVHVVLVTPDAVNADVAYMQLPQMQQLRRALSLEENETVLAICKYNFYGVYLRHTKLCLELYMSRLWSYVSGLGVGVLAMYVGYAIVTRVLQTDTARRNRILDAAGLADLYYSVRDGDIDGGLFNMSAQDHAMTKRDFVAYMHRMSYHVQIALTFHDESTAFMAGSSFYKFLVQDKFETRHGVYDGVLIRTVGRSGDSTYEIQPMRSGRHAYVVFDNSPASVSVEASVRALRGALDVCIHVCDAHTDTQIDTESLYDASKRLYFRK